MPEVGDDIVKLSVTLRACDKIGIMKAATSSVAYNPRLLWTSVSVRPQAVVQAKTVPLKGVDN